MERMLARVENITKKVASMALSHRYRSLKPRLFPTTGPVGSVGSIPYLAIEPASPCLNWQPIQTRRRAGAVFIAFGDAVNSAFNRRALCGE